MDKTWYYKKDFFSSNDDILLVESDYLRRVWFKAAVIWKVVDLVIVIGAFITSSLAIILGVLYPSKLLCPMVLSFMSAILTFAGLACSSGQNSSKYRQVYQLINRAVIINIDKNGDVDEKGRSEIKKAIITGEFIIGKTYGIDYDLLEKENIELT